MSNITKKKDGVTLKQSFKKETRKNKRAALLPSSRQPYPVQLLLCLTSSLN